MRGRQLSRSNVVAVSIVALTWLVTCSSSSAADGASCSKGSECKSGSCGDGLCLGSDCTCQGSDCRGRSSCDDGWLCTLAVDPTTDGPTPRCRQQCTGTTGCPTSQHCDQAICRRGPTAFVLTWLDIPRTRACGSRVPCEYKVRPSEGVTVDTYTWTFGGAPAVVTTEPTTSTTWPKAGSFGVNVEAHATTGATASVATTEIICDGAIGSACDPNESACCEGSCNAQGVCR